MFTHAHASETDADCHLATLRHADTVTLSVRSAAVAQIKCNYPQFPVESLSDQCISMGNTCGAA